MKKNKSKFLTILGYEYMSYIKNKVFIATTVIILLLMLLIALLPSIIMGLNVESNDNENPEDMPKVAIINKAYDDNELKAVFESGFKDNEIIITKDSEEQLKSKVNSGDYAFGVIVNDPLSFNYVTESNSVTDMTVNDIEDLMIKIYRQTQMKSYGLSAKQADEILSAEVKSTIITTGVDQTMKFIPAYILVLVLYIAILMYGQLISSSVIAEKSSRAMEMLITCARPSDLMFGKVIAAGLAGFTQMVVLLGVGLLPMSMGLSGIDSDIGNMFAIPVETIIFAILFFVLGFFIFAFLMAAASSLASRAEDANTLLTPVTLLVVLVFIPVIMCMVNGSVDSVFMTVLSYLPFASPLAMFARATMTDVQIWEVLLSVVLQIGYIYLVGRFAAAVYKMGVLMYGKPPKVKDVFKMLIAKKN